MSFKGFLSRAWEILKTAWKSNYIQRISRVTYDIVANLLLFFVVIGAMLAFFAGGVGAGYFASLVKDEPIRDYDDMRRDIYNYEETSKLYFAGNIYIGDIRAELQREEIPLKDISQLSIDAVIATEDQSFYEHNGVVPKAVVRALLQELTNSDTKSGGSTLTQQLIKNQILTNEVSFDRKAKEMLLAMRLENFFEKDEILEAYMNIVPYGRNAEGRNIAGIQTAAMGIFGVNANELTLPQAAYIAGLPQNPYTFTPFKTNGELKDEEGLAPGIERMEVVLKRMYQNENISEQEYNEAIKHDIVGDFTTRSQAPMEKYPAVVLDLQSRATDIILELLAEEDGYTMDDINESDELREEYTILADRALRMNGYHIYSTIDKKVYDTMQTIAAEYPHYGPDNTFSSKDEDGNKIEVTDQIEVGASLIENSTGKVLGYIPGRNFSLDNQFNYATQAYRSPGSTIKPLLYAAGMELGAIQPGSVIADVPVTYADGYSPKNFAGGYYGLVSLREALTHSYNVSAVQAYQKFVYQNPAKNFLMEMGYTPERLNAERQEILSLILGGTEVTVEQNTAAFATFGNNGNHVTPYVIEKITTSDGTVIFEHTPDPVNVFSEETNYLMVDMLRDVVRGGTAGYVPSQLKAKQKSVDWVGKTGTSQEYKDAWFVATNPNVTLGTWIGYDTPSSINCKNCSLSYSQRNQNLWARIANELAEIDSELFAPSERFKQPAGVVSRSYCAVSGMAPSDLCKEAGLVRSDLFNVNFLPKGGDDSLVGGNMPLVTIDGENVTAGPDTPTEFTTKSGGGIAFNPEFLKEMGYDKLSDLSVLIPRKNPAAGWSKISFNGKALAEIDDHGNKGKIPAKPTSLEKKGNNIVWKGSKGQLIVGYRVYHAPEGSEKFSLVTHTLKATYPVPEKPGTYHIRAVNYDGLESDPSAVFIVHPKEEEAVEKPEKPVEKPKEPAKPKDPPPKVDPPKAEPDEPVAPEEPTPEDNQT